MIPISNFQTRPELFYFYIFQFKTYLKNIKIN